MEDRKRTFQVSLLHDLNVGGETAETSSEALTLSPTKLLKLLVPETRGVLSPSLPTRKPKIKVSETIYASFEVESDLLRPYLVVRIKTPLDLLTQRHVQNVLSL